MKKITVQMSPDKTMLVASTGADWSYGIPLQDTPSGRVGFAPGAAIGLVRELTFRLLHLENNPPNIGNAFLHADIVCNLRKYGRPMMRRELMAMSFPDRQPPDVADRFDIVFNQMIESGVLVPEGAIQGALTYYKLVEDNHGKEGQA
jgi:hypothetical protein